MHVLHILLLYNSLLLTLKIIKIWTAVKFIILTHAIFSSTLYINKENETDGDDTQLLPKTQPPNPLTPGMSTKLLL